MNQYKILALDETGKASLKHLSSAFVLSGLIVSESFLPRLEKTLIKLKKKFFNDPDVVFHCRDMLRRKGPFSILRDGKVAIRFWSEFVSVFNHQNISIATIIVDKEKARKLGWNEVAILRKSYAKIFEEFTKKYLKEAGRGKIVAESDPYQDKFLLEAHNRIQILGIPSEGIKGTDYRSKLTCVSLVNKLNLDVHVQMADNLAIMGHMFYELKINKRKKLSRIEKMFKRLIDRKITEKVNPGIFEVLV
jgi:hypothetical protein